MFLPLCFDLTWELEENHDKFQDGCKGLFLNYFMSKGEEGGLPRCYAKAYRVTEGSEFIQYNPNKHPAVVAEWCKRPVLQTRVASGYLMEL